MSVRSLARGTAGVVASLSLAALLAAGCTTGAGPTPGPTYTYHIVEPTGVASTGALTLPLTLVGPGYGDGEQPESRASLAVPLTPGVYLLTWAAPDPRCPERPDFELSGGTTTWELPDDLRPDDAGGRWRTLVYRVLGAETHRVRVGSKCPWEVTLRQWRQRDASARAERYGSDASAATTQGYPRVAR